MSVDGETTRCSPAPGMRTLQRLKWRRIAFASLAGLLAAGTLSACGGDPWLQESNPSGNAFFDLRLAAEIRSFWYVSPPQIDAAAQLLETRDIVPISPERAASLLGHAPDIATGDSLYLIRAIDVTDPLPLRIYKLGTWVQVNAGTRANCFVSSPGIRHQPLIVALPEAPTRLRLTYSCDG